MVFICRSLNVQRREGSFHPDRLFPSERNVKEGWGVSGRGLGKGHREGKDRDTRRMLIDPFSHLVGHRAVWKNGGKQDRVWCSQCKAKCSHCGGDLLGISWEGWDREQEVLAGPPQVSQA